MGPTFQIISIGQYGDRTLAIYSGSDQQVSPGNDEKQTSRAGEARGCHPAGRCSVRKQIHRDRIAREVRALDYFIGRKNAWAGGKLLLDPNRPRLIFELLCKPFKRMAGTTGLEPAASAVTEPLANVTDWN